jgi:hypothetical protein
MLSSVICPAIQYFSTSHKRHDFRKKKKSDMKCVFWFSLQLLSETFLILRKTERDEIKNVYWFSCKVRVIFVRIEWNLIFLDRFSKNTHIQFHENPSSGSRVVPCGLDGQTYMSKPIVSFRSFANAPNKWMSCQWPFVYCYCVSVINRLLIVNTYTLRRSKYMTFLLAHTPFVSRTWVSSQAPLLFCIILSRN